MGRQWATKLAEQGAMTATIDAASATALPVPTTSHSDGVSYLKRRVGELKAAYQAAVQSRFRRTRTRLGGTADAHYANPTEYWRIREYVRDMDRNDSVIGQLIDRAVDNIVGRGFQAIPRTGDKGLDREILDRWEDWSCDPLACDVAGRFSFKQQQRLALRHTLGDGDIFANLTGDGAVQLLEGDFVDSHASFADDVIHGVEVNGVGRPVRYWIRQLGKGQRERSGRFSSSRQSDYDIRSAFDDAGNPQVLHVLNPKRITQNRGMSALTPVFDVCGQFEDATFAKLIQQQITSCVALFIERTSDYGSDMQLGDREEVTVNSNTETIENIAPGLVLRGNPGEKMSAFTPNVAPAEWFEHIKLLLRLIGANLGMPLTLVLLDTSNTTFHGYRGELAQAQMGFRCIQDWLVERFHSPIYRWKVREWFPDLARRNRRVLSHRFGRPGWPYVDPYKDAQADSLSLEKLLISPREQQASRGRDWETTVRETVEDRQMMIRAAMKAAEEINAELSDGAQPITWREVLCYADAPISAQPAAVDPDAVADAIAQRGAAA